MDSTQQESSRRAVSRSSTLGRCGCPAYRDHTGMDISLTGQPSCMGPQCLLAQRPLWPGRHAPPTLIPPARPKTHQGGRQTVTGRAFPSLISRPNTNENATGFQRRGGKKSAWHCPLLSPANLHGPRGPRPPRFLSGLGVWLTLRRGLPAGGNHTRYPRGPHLSSSWALWGCLEAVSLCTGENGVAS